MDLAAGFFDLGNELFVLLEVSDEDTGKDIWVGNTMLGDKGTKISGSTDNKDREFFSVKIHFGEGMVFF